MNTIADTGGRLLVSSHNSNQVMRYNETNGVFIDVMVSAGSGGLSLPHGLAFGPDRNLYVASAGNDRILKYDGMTGAFISTFVTNGSGGLDYPAGILFGPDGHLYVASQLSDQILKFHGLTGAFLGAFVSAASGGLDGPSVPVFGPDSNLYVTGRFDNRVYRYNGTSGAFIDVFVTNQLSQPFGCAFGPDGHFYVSSGNNNAIRRFNGQTGVYINDMVSSGLNLPVQFIFGPDTNIYACSFNGSVVQRYNGSTGVFIDTFVAAGNGLSGPNFLTFRPAGSGWLDRDGDGMPDYWEITHAAAGLMAGISNSPLADFDLDGVTDVEEFIGDTLPTSSNDYFRVSEYDPAGGISFRASTGRIYTVQFTDDLMGAWSNAAGFIDVPGTGIVHSVGGLDVSPLMQHVRVNVELP